MAGGKKQKKKKKRRKKRRRNPVAAAADRHDLYQRAVQSPDADIEFFLDRFTELRGRAPRAFREDFCGTGLLASRWVAGAPDRTALGVDIDPAVLDWGRRHNVSVLEPAARERVTLVAADVRDVEDPRVDLTCAMNFSFCVFKERRALGTYFASARRALRDDGLFVCELYGGTEAVIEIEEEREVDDFTFVWEQAKYNPVTHETLCHIHFEFEDGSRLKRAFTYDWRLWTLPEVRELLAEAGFEKSTVYWEEVDEDGDGTGEHHATEEEENQEGWLVYIVAEARA